MKHTIEIEGLPEGWDIISCKLHGTPNDSGYISGIVRLKKKQPRRIVLEETDEKVDPEWNHQHWVYTNGSIVDFRVIAENKWRIVEDSGENND